MDGLQDHEKKALAAWAKCLMATRGDENLATALRVLRNSQDPAKIASCGHSEQKARRRERVAASCDPRATQLIKSLPLLANADLLLELGSHCDRLRVAYGRLLEMMLRFETFSVSELKDALTQLNYSDESEASNNKVEFAETRNGLTRRLVTVRCGKPNCKCASGAGHGPYWYGYTRSRDTGKTAAIYMGKKKPSWSRIRETIARQSSSRTSR